MNANQHEPLGGASLLRRKNDPDKIGIAVRLRRETTLSIKDIVAPRVSGDLKHGERAFTSRDERARVGRFEPKVRWNMNGKQRNIWFDPCPGPAAEDRSD